MRSTAVNGTQVCVPGSAGHITRRHVDGSGLSGHITRRHVDGSGLSQLISRSYHKTDLGRQYFLHNCVAVFCAKFRD